MRQNPAKEEVGEVIHVIHRVDEDEFINLNSYFIYSHLIREGRFLASLPTPPTFGSPFGRGEVRPENSPPCSEGVPFHSEKNSLIPEVIPFHSKKNSPPLREKERETDKKL